MEQPDSLSEVRALISLLRRHTLRTRVGVWQIPLRYVDRERDIAVRLGVEAVDARDPIKERLPVGTRYVRLSAEKVLQALDQIAYSAGQTDCALVYNVDLLLAGLNREARQTVWESLFDGLPHRPRALLLVVPETAHDLMLSERLYRAWQRDKRIV